MPTTSSSSTSELLAHCIKRIAAISLLRVSVPFHFVVLYQVVFSLSIYIYEGARNRRKSTNFYNERDTSSIFKLIQRCKSVKSKNMFFCRFISHRFNVVRCVYKRGQNLLFFLLFYTIFGRRFICLPNPGQSRQKSQERKKYR